MGHTVLCDYHTDENVFEAHDFRKCALDNLSATIAVDGEDVWLSGEFDPMLLTANGDNDVNGSGGANGKNVLYRKGYCESSTRHHNHP